MLLPRRRAAKRHTSQRSLLPFPRHVLLLMVMLLHLLKVELLGIRRVLGCNGREILLLKRPVMLLHHLGDMLQVLKLRV